MTADKPLEYIEKNKARFLEELKTFLRFESVSAQSIHKTDIIKCAFWLRDHFISLGLNASIIETSGNPIVRASIKGRSDKRILIYGHYDVQPAEPVSQWLSPPFEPLERDGQIFARGATDDKGQLFAHIKGVETVLKTGTMPSCEIVFLLEGEEESRGDSLARYVKENKTELAPYAVIISDGSMYRQDTPAIAYGLRGIIGFDIIIKGAKQDLHSGSFGGAVPNPAVALINILAKCVDADGNILIPGFYDDVVPLSQWEQDNLKRLAFDDKAFCQELGINKILGSPDIPTPAKMWARPTFEINGIYGGYTGQGGKTIIPSQAAAKLSLRLVPHQDPEKLAKLTVDHIKKICPDNVSIEFIGPDWTSPILFDVTHPIFTCVQQSLKAGFNSGPVFIREGGSISVAETFWRQLNAPVVLMGFGSEYDGAHAPNEHFSLEHFINGIKTSAHLLTNMD